MFSYATKTATYYNTSGPSPFVPTALFSMSAGVYAYKWLPGFGSLYSLPATLNTSVRDTSFNPTRTAVAMATQSSVVQAPDGLMAYAWSGNGYGTKYSNPSVGLPNVATKCDFTASGDAIFATILNTSPYIAAYQWSDLTGFGTRYSSPATLPASIVRNVAASPAGSSVVYAANEVGAYKWNDVTGFGTKFSNASIPTAYGSFDAQFHPDASVVFTALSPQPVFGSKGAFAYSWSESSGFGTAYPSSVPVFDYGSVDVYYDGSNIAMAKFGGPYLEVYRFDKTSGIHSKYTDPASPPPAYQNGPGFTKDGTAVMAGIYIYNFASGIGFGSSISAPSAVVNLVGLGHVIWQNSAI